MCSVLDVSNLNSGDNDDRPIDFSFEDTSKFSPKMSQRMSRSSSSSSYTGGFANTGQLMFRMIVRCEGVIVKSFPLTQHLSPSLSKKAFT